MQTIKINVVNKVATAEGTPFIVCGNSDYTIAFNFDAAWAGQNLKTARFTYEQDGEEVFIEVPFSGNSCKAPVIHNTKKVDIGVYAGDILSTTRCRINCKASILDGEGIEHEEPAEDIYGQLVEIANEAVTAATEFEANTRETFANAFKNTLYGSVVTADDVSPVTHKMDVRVTGKNLLNLLSVKGINNEAFVIDGDNIVFKNFGGANGYGCIFSNVPLYIGNTYTFSVESVTATSSYYGWLISYKDGTRENSSNSKTLTLTIKKEVKQVNFYIAFGDLATKQDITIAKPMCELGDKVTEYEPYTDPSTITLTRVGKNLWNGGDVTVTDSYAAVKLDCVLFAGTTYTLRADVESNDTDDTRCLVYDPVNQRHFGAVGRGKGQTLTFTPTVNSNQIQLYASYGYQTAVGDVATFKNIQLEIGNTATEYEEYKGETYIPNADGVVYGITSVSPNMTLLTDTEGAVIYCEYNRDSNEVVTDLKTSDGTVVSQNADFAEVAEWADGNPDNEDRTGYFVCADVPVRGIVMRKATSIDDVKGVSILAPAFAGNYSKDKLDSNGNLLPKYSYVAIIGFVPVRDNGTCTVGGRCMPDDNGCAIPSSNNMGYQVVNRIDENRVLIIIEPNGDMVQRIKTKVNNMNDTLANAIRETKSGEIVVADDVSPVEHNLGVKVENINIFYAPVTSRTFTERWNGGLWDGAYGKREDITALRGKTITYQAQVDFSKTIETTATFRVRIWWYGANGESLGSSQPYNNYNTDNGIRISSLTVTVPQDATYAVFGIEFYFNGTANALEGSSATISNPMVEISSTASTYVPHKELSTVKVSRYGKNLWNGNTKAIYNLKHENGVFTQTVADGRANLLLIFQEYKNGGYVNQIDEVYVYNPSVYKVTFTKDSTFNELRFGHNGTSTMLTVLIDVSNLIDGNTYTFQCNITNTTQNKFSWQDIQIEVGSIATEYEPYKQVQTVTANADGTVIGLKSVSPNMVVATDTSDVIVDTTYNVDTKTYIDQKFAELSQALLNL